jgi:SPOR domain
MALTPRQAATLFLGTSLFGLLTFTSGLLIGVGIGGPAAVPGLPGIPAAPIASNAPQASPAPAASPAAVTASAAGSGSGAVVLPMPKPAPASAPAAAPPAATKTAAAAPQGAAAAPGASAAGAAGPAAGPVPLSVKDFRVGLPLELAPVSPLRGKLVDVTLAAPRSLVVAPPAAGAAAAAPGAPTAAPPAQAAAMAGPPSPFVFSVQAGSFLVKANAERLAEELAKRGYAAQVLVAQSPGEPTWYPVVLAPVTDAALVRRLAQEFSASEGHQAEVVSWLAGK